MRETEKALAENLEAILRSVAGVTAIYPAAPVPAVIVGEILATALPVTPPRLVVVDAEPDGITVTALIGVTDQVAAREIGRVAHTEIRDYLARTGTKVSAVTVRIGVVGS